MPLHFEQEIPLAPLIEVSRSLSIPDATLRLWIRKGFIKAHPAIKSRQKSSLNLIDLESLALHLGQNQDAMMRKLLEDGVTIFARAVRVE